MTECGGFTISSLSIFASSESRLMSMCRHAYGYTTEGVVGVQASWDMASFSHGQCESPHLPGLYTPQGEEA